ncbi:diacylglycerol/lipid kinase family protein [Jiella pacifica]|uniref:Diacylglycerol kinase n=1 Tax=Jiella pacifica TaxID=2696469 RepID=A0A6N9T348_9HYPH|nr:diacylglycerol kinase family protein [Jiella pacifica]NDW05797.1 diacylglycerol kinase [Jiella pacifica]
MDTTHLPAMPGDAAAGVSPRSFHVVLNAKAGSAEDGGETICAAIESGLKAIGAASVTIDADRGSPFEERIRRAIESDAEIVVSAGGDGTATALATAIIEAEARTGKTLAVLPLGTANLLARDLEIPLDLDEAIAAIGLMQPRQIDVGMVNGRIFLHKVVIGFAPAVAAKREELRSHRDLKSIARFLRYFLSRLAKPPHHRLSLRLDDGPQEEIKVRALAIANNAYDEGLGRFFSRARLDRGHLTVYALKHLTLSDVLRLSTGMMIGRWRKDEALSEREAMRVDVRTRHDKRVRVMIDGEVMKLGSPLRFEIHPGALRVLAPLAIEAASATRATSEVAA